MRNLKKKIALYLVAVMLLGTNLTVYAQEKTIPAEEVGVTLERWMESDSEIVSPGRTVRVNTYMRRGFDTNKYEYYNDMNHVYTSLIVKNTFELSGNTSQNTKIIDSFLTSEGFFESFDLQIGEDETAEEITVSVKLGAWGYYLKNKETGEIFRVYQEGTGETISATFKILQSDANHSGEVKAGFKGEVMFGQSSVMPGESTEIGIKKFLIYDNEKFSFQNDNAHNVRADVMRCSISGNTCEKTRIEHQEYGRYILYVDETEKAEELTVTMQTGTWAYFLKDKITGEIFKVSGENFGTIEGTVKIGVDMNDSSSDSHEGRMEVVSSQSGASSIDVAGEAGIEEKPSNEVTGINGKRIVSTIGGVYQATDVAGVAVVTPKDEVNATVAASQMTEGNVRFYVCNNRDKVQKEALKQAAERNGKTVLETINMDMYFINKEGVVNKIDNTLSKIKIVIGIPARYRADNSVFSVGIIGKDGTFYLLEDVDSDPNTVTIETNQFGAMVLVK